MVPIRSVKFWINAFIPGHIPGYTIVVPAGAHRGKTMIPGPGAWNLGVNVHGVPVSAQDLARGLSGQPYRGQTRRVGVDAVGVSDCYLTDQRTFSNQIHAKSRMHSEFRLDLTGPQVRFTQWHHCDETTELDCEDGCVECSKKGATKRMRFEIPPGTIRSSMGPITVTMKCAASNPCSPSSRLFGDIDYSGSIVVNVNARRIEIDGLLDQFPAFEAYATINNGAGVALFQLPPPAGNTVMNLPRNANRSIRASLQDTNGNGVFDLQRRQP
jgi:hypothetical protein